MTATINNNTISMNVQDTLPILLRLLDPEELARYNDMTPTTLDYLASYNDAVDYLPFQIETATGEPPYALAFFPSATEGTPVLPKPTFSDAEAVPGTYGFRPQAFISYPGNTLSHDLNRVVGHTTLPKSRGSWKLKAISTQPPGSATPGTLPGVGDNTVYVTFDVTEPLLLSPFIFGSGHGKQGFYGIQTMNFQMNMMSNANRAWRCACLTPGYTKTVTIDSFSNSTLIFQFLTPHPSDFLESRNVVPCYELPVYRTSNFTDLPPGRKFYGQPDPTGLFADPAAVTLSSSNIQLSSIPDKLIVFVRKSIANTLSSEPDYYATITNISLTWNNQAGLLSTMTPQQLYRNSVQSGLVGLSWEQFSGNVSSICGRLANTAGGAPSAIRGGYSGVGANLNGGNNPGFQLIPTTGTILVLNFGEVIQLSDDFYAPGSLGSFNLQLTLQVVNNTNVTWFQGSYELVIIPMNCGVFVNERGTSSTYTALLTKQDALDANSQPAYSVSEVHRMVGGSFLNNLKSSLGWIHSKLPMVKHVLSNIPHAYAQTGAKV